MADDIEKLVERLRARMGVFSMDGNHYYLTGEPDPDCITAASTITSLQAELAKRESERLAWLRSHRWNIEEDGSTLVLCRGDHDGDNCEYERFVPEAELAVAREALERTERNRDMWRGQCDRQARELLDLREEIREAAASRSTP